MRNEVAITVVQNEGFCSVHFTQAKIVKDPNAVVSIAVNSEKMATVPAPTKLQGADFNLWFPLSATTSTKAIDFAEIERIMVINKVAHNVVNIEHKRGNEKSDEYRVVYNEWVHPDK